MDLKSNVFDQTKSRIDKADIQNELDCIQTIVLNISEYCSLKCSICPRSVGYPNIKTFMNPLTILNIKKRLQDIDYKGTISISGMGEPCEHPKLMELLRILTTNSHYEPKYKIKLLTNGMPNVNYRKIEKMGIKILVSVHDNNSIGYLQEKFKNTSAILRDHDPQSLFTELKITNRAGYMDSGEIQTGCCNYPFYKMMIDIDGSYLLCPEDWNRVTKKSENNVHTKSIKEYFIDYLKDIKKELITNGRSNLTPCSKCSMNGSLMGGKMVEYFKSKYC